MFGAGVLLPQEAAMVRIVELDHQSVDGLALLLHTDEDTPTSVGETIDRIYVVDKDNFRVDLQVQDCLKRCVLDTASVVSLECLDCFARIFCFDSEQFSLYLIQFGPVSRVDFGVGSINVDGVFKTGVSFGTNSGSQEGDVLFCMMSCPHPVQKFPIILVLALTMVCFKSDNSETSPQVSNDKGQTMLLVRRLLEDIPSLWRLELEQVAKDENREATKDTVDHGDLS